MHNIQPAHVSGLPEHERARLREARAAKGGTYRLRLGPEVLCRAVSKADSMGARMKGLLGRSSLGQNEGLWIVPCNSIHMFFMRFAIDAVFVDDDLQVVRVHEHVKPWRMARGGRHASSVLELPAGTVSFYKLRVGDRLSLE